MQTKVPIIGENLVASIMRHNLSSLTLDFMKFASIYFFCVLMILELLLFWFFSLKETEWRAFESWGGGGGGIWFVLQSSNTGYWRSYEFLNVSNYFVHHLKNCSVMFQHTPFDGVVKINSIILAIKYLKEKGGEWKVC